MAVRPHGSAIFRGMELAERLENARSALLETLPEAWALYVYGSTARGDAGPASDVDLAVLLPPGRRIPDKLSLMATLAAALGRDVDLVDLREAGDFLRMEVLRDGKVLHAADPDRLLEWEARAMSSYFDHRFRIRGIVEDFARSGVGYAQ